MQPVVVVGVDNQVLCTVVPVTLVSLPISVQTQTFLPSVMRLQCALIDVLFPVRWDLHRNSDCETQNSTNERRLMGHAVDLLSDLENILGLPIHWIMVDNRSLLLKTNIGPNTYLSRGPTQNPGINFDIED
ncbi:hypothetical protein HPG69_014708 [Diceros bicornis minor]|uniref:Uncharacterized protein n=1 Tax=Diceros bicornis minor TaxID=77932 RepID=A0A7J7EYA4_DICBM|nr:hypothetical protein HPG69_014708 [Diceros bicornis minor]